MDKLLSSIGACALAISIAACGDAAGTGGDDSADGGAPGGGATGTTQGGASDGGSASGGSNEGGAGDGGATPSCAPIDLSGPSEAVAMPAGCPGASCTSVGFTPLDDLVGGEYLGISGGLYCNSNQRPADYENAGVALAEGIQPLDASGAPDPDGKYALVGIGMSHTTMEFSAFIDQYEDDPALDPSLVLVDGALGGHATPQWLDPDNEAWTNLTQRLAQKSVTDAQVVAAWVKLAQQTPQTECDAAGFVGEGCFPAHADKLANDIRTILHMLSARFPNLKLVYLSSRSYAGYANSDLNPEPYAYQSGISVKKLVLDKILDAPEVASLPYLAWGPYLWADGLTPRSDGLTYAVDEFVDDGTHPNGGMRAKIGDMLYDFFTTDTTAKPWFAPQ